MKIIMNGDELTVSVDDGPPVKLRDMSIKADLIDVSYGMHVQQFPTGQTIKMTLDQLPCTPDVGGKHKLHVLQGGVLVSEYDAIIIEITTQLLGPAEKSVQMEWGTAYSKTGSEVYTFGGAGYNFGGAGPALGGAGYDNSGKLLSSALPALSLGVAAPCVCGHRSNLGSIIIHLNDVHKWTREEIADWLDSLDVDLTFPVPDSIPSNIN